MRLTPFRTHSSTNVDPDESSLDVEIYYPSVDRSAEGGSDREASTVESILTSDPTLEAVIEDLETPATVDELVDRLVDPSDWVNIDLWGDVHERLYRVDLPELDAANIVEFDPDSGVVDVPDDS